MGKLEVARVIVKGVWDIAQEKGFPPTIVPGEPGETVSLAAGWQGPWFITDLGWVVPGSA